MKLKNFLYLTFLLAIHSFAVGTYTTIESGVTIYSEYYPNPKAKFKGTIILENGSGSTTEEWTQNKQFLTCANQYGALFMYDRNGLGKSPADLHTSVSNPITAELVNSKLIKLLNLRHVKAPYLVIGHSYGGLYVDYFARKYPNLTKGILMVDPQPINSQYSDKIMSIINIESWSTIPNQELYSKYSYDNAKRLHLDSAAVIYYQLRGFEQTTQQLNALPPLSNNIPLILISALQMESANLIKEPWLENQKQYLNKNPDSKIITVTSGHFVQLENPNLVCNQIKELVKN
ncbi:MAG: alpha/beta hydrolase [Burkholderiales bacterium]|nr:alpha/beta hydrolase [Burkholderiales bacterium]